MTTETVGAIAADNAIVLMELSAHSPSLEATYMQLTGDSVDYRTIDVESASDER